MFCTESMQAIHRHIPVLLRNLGSCSELLDIIYKLPDGSENLVTLVFSHFYFRSFCKYKINRLEICFLLIVILFCQVLQVLTEESTPSADLIGAVKHLYYTKIKVKP
jgi:symplekin